MYLLSEVTLQTWLLKFSLFSQVSRHRSVEAVALDFCLLLQSHLALTFCFCWHFDEGLFPLHR